MTRSSGSAALLVRGLCLLVQRIDCRVEDSRAEGEVCDRKQCRGWYITISGATPQGCGKVPVIVAVKSCWSAAIAG